MTDDPAAQEPAVLSEAGRPQIMASQSLVADLVRRVADLEARATAAEASAGVPDVIGPLEPRIAAVEASAAKYEAAHPIVLQLEAAFRKLFPHALA